MVNAGLLYSLLLAGCSNYRVETLWVASNALITCDVGQTSWASDDGAWDRPIPGQPGKRYLEMNPVLGSTPSEGKLTAWYGIDLAITSTIMVAPMPTWLKTAALGVIVTAESYAVSTRWSQLGPCGVHR